MAKPLVLNDNPGERKLKLDLAALGLQLDLTSDPWNLGDGAVPVIEGLDIIHRGVVRPDGGRKALDTDASSSSIDDTITTVWPCNLVGKSPLVFRGALAVDTAYAGHPIIMSRYTTAVGSPRVISQFDDWPTELVGALIAIDSDGRYQSPKFARITNITGAGKILNYSVMLDGTVLPAFYALRKFCVYGSVDCDRRGVLISDGRRFYILRGQTWDLWHDLGDDAYLGVRWEITQLTETRIMAVAPDQIPRAFNLVYHENLIGGGSAPLVIPPDPTFYYAGLIAPRPPIQNDGIGSLIPNATCKMALVGTVDPLKTLSYSNGTAIKIRGVNLETGAESQFADVYNYYHDITASQPTQQMAVNFAFDDGVTTTAVKISSPILTYYTFLAGDRLVVYGPSGVAGTFPIVAKSGATEIQVSGAAWGVGVTGIYAEVLTTNVGTVRAFINLNTLSYGDGLQLPLDPKWTHIEVWRTDSAGGTYYLESRIEIGVDLQDPVYPEPAGGWPNPTSGAQSLVGSPISATMVMLPCEMRDAQLIAQNPMVSSDISSGRPPPVCKQAVQVQGVTICMGAAEVEQIQATFRGRGWYLYEATYSAATKRITRGTWPGTDFTTYTFVAGDEFVFFLPNDATYVGQSIPITSKFSANVLQLDNSAPAVDLTVSGYIRRPISVDWPIIRSDELVYHSRTDKFAPESFVSDPVRLSSVGDTFRRAVVVGDYCAVVMNSGVHLLWAAADGLEHETVANQGMGTPWKDSVVVYDKAAIWCTDKGPVAMTVSGDPDNDGHRGKISPLDGGRMRSWFQEARDNGDDIDAGVDPGNACIRFRRKPALNPEMGETLQLCITTGQWTIIKWDSGTRFVTTRFAEATESTEERLYSLCLSNLFQENFYSDTNRYAGKLSKGTIKAADGITLTSIPGDKMQIERSNPQPLFSSAMLGDVVYFSSTNPAVDGQARLILSSPGGAIQFDKVAGLAEGDKFIIGPVRFRVRTGPVVGTDEENVKVIHGVRLDAIPGTQDEYEDVTIRSYEHYLETAASTDTVPVFADDDAGHETVDRYSDVEGVEADLQIEIEHVDNCSDWHLRRANAIVREEGSAVADSDAT